MFEEKISRLREGLEEGAMITADKIKIKINN